MYAYGYEISFNYESHKKSIILLKIEELPSIDFNFELKFHNNQRREVKLISNYEIDKNNKNQKYAFIIKDLLLFFWSEDESIVNYISLSDESTHLLEYWTLHTFLPLYLTQKKVYYFLHAGAVEILDTPVLFIADSYGGKSTLTNFFMNMNHTMISDDKVATFEKDDKIYSVPSYSYHRPYRRVEDLGILVENFSTKSKVINCMFNLVKTDSDGCIVINEIKGIEKFKILRYATDIDIQMHKEERFKYLSKIANKVQIYNITIPWDLDRLEEVYNSILNFIKRKGS